MSKLEKLQKERNELVKKQAKEIREINRKIAKEKKEIIKQKLLDQKKPSDEKSKTQITNEEPISFAILNILLEEHTD
jgi:hypothetical protein